MFADSTFLSFKNSNCDEKIVSAVLSFKQNCI